MGFSVNPIQTDLLSDYITVRTAADISGYNQQYLRRLLRENTFRSRRLGQLWLIDRYSFFEYLTLARGSEYKRYGPQFRK